MDSPGAFPVFWETWPKHTGHLPSGTCPVSLSFSWVAPGPRCLPLICHPSSKVGRSVQTYPQSPRKLRGGKKRLTYPVSHKETFHRDLRTEAMSWQPWDRMVDAHTVIPDPRLPHHGKDRRDPGADLREGRGCQVNLPKGRNSR